MEKFIDTISTTCTSTVTYNSDDEKTSFLFQS